MKEFQVIPKIVMFDTVDELCTAYGIGAGDLLFYAGEFMAERYFAGRIGEALLIDCNRYGSGEPTDLMAESICSAIGGYEYSRVFAVGGGTVLDLAKLFALEKVSPVVDLFERRLEAVKAKKLILVPTTCGTGSEMTNISILELTAIHSKFGLADPALYADEAVLVPELLEGLPFRFFAASAIDALVHSVESFTSPKAGSFSQMFSRQAMAMIIRGFKAIAEGGPEARRPYLKDFLIASNYAGIAFGNAGCAAVHALSYPLGAGYHVPHGESNYCLFTAVYKKYLELDPDGGIMALNSYLAELLGCSEDAVYDALDSLLGHLMEKKRMRDYGVREDELETYVTSVMTKQTRLMNNNYTKLDAEAVMEIYRSVY